ncbi:MAG: TetR family transcriptional regulator [FCB group bacterium]|jgi:AcrR family transcriptional regulator
MSEHLQVKEPKDRILDASASLIAHKGFASVGVREIASAADVNISMISYYFGGKVGILKAIIEEYFNDLKKIVTPLKDIESTPEDKMKAFIKELVLLIRTKTNLCKVAILEMPYDFPEITEFKLNLFMEHMKLIGCNFENIFTGIQNKYKHIIIGPAFISMIFSHFIFADMINSAYKIEFDDKFYDTYAENIATLFLYGVKAINH